MIEKLATTNSAIPIANLTLGGTKGEIIHFKPSHIRNTSISYTANTPMKPAINFQLFNINSPSNYLLTNERIYCIFKQSAFHYTICSLNCH